jgi:hypothetical protein
MGISQQIGASSLIKPGVIDSSAARPASPYEGQVIFQKDTDQLLVWNGTAWVIPNQTTQNPEGLELVATTTFTTTTTPFVNGCFSSSYQNYRIMINIAGSGSSNLRMRIRSGTSTPETNTVYSRWGFSVAAGVLTNESSGSQTSLFLGGYYAGEQTPYSMDMFNPNEAKQTLILPYSWNSNSGTTAFMTGRVDNNNVYTGLEITGDSGTLTGSLRIYGYRNS